MIKQTNKQKQRVKDKNITKLWSSFFIPVHLHTLFKSFKQVQDDVKVENGALLYIPVCFSLELFPLVVFFFYLFFYCGTYFSPSQGIFIAQTEDSMGETTGHVFLNASHKFNTF